MEKRPNHNLDHRRERPLPGWRNGYEPDTFFGLDVEEMSPKAQVVAGLAVSIPVAVAGAAVLIFVPSLWWLVFVFGWPIFPAFRLLVRGIASLSDNPKESPPANGKERELLEALREHGELTPARAAMETSLTVTEADKMLKELAEGGHLEVRVRGGGLFYGLREPGGEGAERELEGRG
ncbi:MAG: UbiA family prenyltransferase [Actinomycetota bacterium]|nr:UbiA family prenyltransferase [Actinomycetota bacterium]